jgi:hypothetical protein
MNEGLTLFVTCMDRFFPWFLFGAFCTFGFWTVSISRASAARSKRSMELTEMAIASNERSIQIMEQLLSIQKKQLEVLEEFAKKPK